MRHGSHEYRAADEPGSGRYILLAQLGDGPRGPIYIARSPDDPGAESLYELEVSRFASGEDAELQAFLQSLEHAMRLTHPNVIGVIDVGSSSDGPFVVTEHVEDCMLSELQDRNRAIRPPRLVLAALIDALRGLDAAHASYTEGVSPAPFHGAIGPDTIRVGSDGTTRLSGFGRARPRIQATPSRRSRLAVGYLAPEQVTEALCDRRTDVFSIGVVLWNALTGKKLFHDRSEGATIANVLERKVPRPSAIGLQPPPVLDDVVLRALERDPVRRFQTAGELAAALDDVARDAGLLASPQEVGEWVATTFGAALATRRRTIRELASRPPAGALDLPALPGLGGATGDDTGELLSREQLAFTTGPMPRTSAVFPVPSQATVRVIGPGSPGRPAPRARTSSSQAAMSSAPAADARPSNRRQLAIVAIAAFAVVIAILGWRKWHRPAAANTVAAATTAQAAQAAPPTELEVTVLDVRDVTPEPTAAVVPAEPTAPDAIAPAGPDAPVARPQRPTVQVPKRPPAAPVRGAATAAKTVESPTRSPEPRPETTSAKPPETGPATPRPKPETLESNPYVYK